MLEPNMPLVVATALIVGVVAYVLGHLVDCICCNAIDTNSQKGEFELFFRKTAIGVFLLTLLYAIGRSGGITIVAGATIPILLGLSTVFLQKNDFRNLKFSCGKFIHPLSVLIAFVVVMITLVIVNYTQTVSLTGEIFDINKDYAYYASVANNLQQMGVETLNVDFANPELIAPMLYRYGELWLTALVGHISGVSFYYALLLVVFPLLGTIALMGVGALCEKYIATEIWKVALTLSVTLLLIVMLFKCIIYTDNPIEISPMKYTSLVIQRFYPILISLLLLLLVNGLHKIAVICIAGFLNPTAIVPIIGGTMVYLCVELLRKKRCDRYFLFSVLIVALSALYFWGFYALSSVLNPYQRESYSLYYAFQLAMWQFGKDSLFQYSTLPLFDMVVNIAPYLILFLLLPRAKRNELLSIARENSILIYIFIFAVLGFSLIWYIKDSIQIYYSIAYPLFVIINSFLVAFIIIRGGFVVRTLAIVCVLLNFIFGTPKSNNPTVLNDNFYSEIATVLRADTAEHRFAWVDFKELCSIPDIFMRDAAYRKPLHNISRFENAYTPIRLDVFDIQYNPSDIGDRHILSSIESNSFYCYTLKHKLQKEIKEAQNRYLRENKIRYVIAPRGWNWFEGRGFIIKREITSPSESYSFYVLEL